MNVVTVPQLLEVLDKEFEPNLAMFRGQTRDWPLLPSIGRYPAVVKGYDNWQTLHDYLIERFLRLGRPYFAGSVPTGIDSWVVGQHHGLPTRLLDTTTNPLKGLFFAVNNPVEDRYDGVFWVFSYDSWREDLRDESRDYWDKELIPFFPAQLHARLTAHEGAFISYPLPRHRKRLRPMNTVKQDGLSMSKFIVPAAAKALLRTELEMLGMQFRLLFPDLDGVARSIRLTELQS